ncbi:type VII secretion-associated serine protease mycosin [Antrihabitans spumae]|uniref:Type VII secretion-associated serine protease mycosin n=1 Tax=Antrihabitans spumae TaxID=3373370 RepID=A0ABW7KHX0_9NOCA
MSGAWRPIAVAALLALSASLGQGSAAADRPPPIDPGRLPSGATPAPFEKTEQKLRCAETAPDGDGPTVPVGQRDLDFTSAWQFTRGAGQLVAVIDTGVARHPRLPGLVPGGDYVGTTDGTDDCDVHGTVVAGIIAATAVDGQGFVGVAPEATILSIRQSSRAFQVAGRAEQQREGQTADGYGDIRTLAAAVVRAADMGARVINISEVACATGSLDDRVLGAAVEYAAVAKDVVIVAAAGNTDENCASNPGLDPLRPTADPWDQVATIVSPAWYDDYVIAVGSVDSNGAPSQFTVAGPWLDVAAPGESITSLDPRRSGLTTGTIDDKGRQGVLRGTSFAVPYVSGTAALVRARFPQLSARQVIDRLKKTAHAPAEGWNPLVGFGVIDPYAAVTADVGTNTAARPTMAAKALPLPAAAAPRDDRPRNIALIGAAAIGGVLALAILASFPIRRRLHLSDTNAGAGSGATPS